MEENLQNKKYLTVKELIFYSLGLFGLQAIIFYINSYQVEFYSGSGMIEASKMVIVTFIILAAKLVSAVFDPLIGNLIDSKKGGKHGKLKPFIVISTIPLSILTVLIFCKVNLTGFALYAYIFVTTTLWSVAMTLATCRRKACRRSSRRIRRKGTILSVFPEPSNLSVRRRRTSWFRRCVCVCRAARE